VTFLLQLLRCSTINLTTPKQVCDKIPTLPNLSTFHLVCWSKQSDTHIFTLPVICRIVAIILVPSFLSLNSLSTPDRFLSQPRQSRLQLPSPPVTLILQSSVDYSKVPLVRLNLFICSQVPWVYLLAKYSLFLSLLPSLQ
jgi:hypothetical protein